MSQGEISERDERTLHAYHDGELGRLARWRFERRLAASPALRRELEALRRLGEWTRRADAEHGSPDLWPGVAGGLRRADADREASAPAGPFGGWLRPALGMAAAAALVVAVFLGLRDTGPAPQPTRVAAPSPALTRGPADEGGGVVRWIDPGSNGVLVIEDDSEATIIWVLEGSEEASPGGGRDVV